MIQPEDVMKASDEGWEDFKKEAQKDPLYYNGPGDLLDTPEGRKKFCALNETGVFRKPDPDFPNSTGKRPYHQKAQPRRPRHHGRHRLRRRWQPDR